MDRAQELKLLERKYYNCQRCPNSRNRETKRVIIFRGNPYAKLCIMGGWPETGDDKIGLPFLGTGGKLLDNLLVECNIDPDKDVFITTLVGCKSDCQIQKTEIRMCNPRIKKILQIVKPKVICFFGAAPAKEVFGVNIKVNSFVKRQLCGKIYPIFFVRDLNMTTKGIDNYTKEQYKKQIIKACEIINNKRKK